MFLDESLYWWLAYSGLLSLIVLALGSGAVLLCSQPARRLRIIELSLVGCLLAPLLGMIPGYPQLAIAWWHDEPLPRSETATPLSAPTAAVPMVSQPDVEPRVHSQGADDSPSRETAEPAATPSRAWDVASWFGGLYLLGLAVAVAWWLLGMAALARVVRTARAASPRCRGLLTEIAGERGARVQLLTSRLVRQPFASLGAVGSWPLHGTTWPPAVIVLPEDLCDDEQAVRWALAHEWAHLEHGDFRAWFVAGLARALFFYQPLVWWLRRELRLCQDYVADARASRQTSQPEDYAEFLAVRAAAGSLHPAIVGLRMGFGRDKSELYRRVVMLVQDRPLESRPPRLWTATVTCVALLSIAVAATLTLLPQRAAMAGIDVDASAATGSGGVAPRHDAPKPNADKPDWGKRFDAVYRLEEGDVVKWIKPPYLPERNEFLAPPPSDFPSGHPLSRSSSPQKAHLFLWSHGSVRDYWSNPTTLERVLKAVGVEPKEVRGRTKLLPLPIEGDWIVRENSPIEERLKGISRILQESFGQDVTFNKRRVEEDLVIVRGRLDLRPLRDDTWEQRAAEIYPGGLPKHYPVFLYFDRRDLKDGHYRILFADSDLTGLLQRVSEMSGVEIVDETESSKAIVGWVIHKTVTNKTLRKDRRKLDKLLENVAQQTSLDIRRERRGVDRWFIEPVEKKGRPAREHVKKHAPASR